MAEKKKRHTWLWIIVVIFGLYMLNTLGIINGDKDKLTPEQKQQKLQQKQQKLQKNQQQLQFLQAYVDANKTSGFIKKFDVDFNEVYVSLHWYNMNVNEKEKFASRIANYCDLKGSTGRIKIYSFQSGKELASFDSLRGFKIK
jgi:Na+-transporting NADH:ubiquinone oxidoreductase subunit NqrC